LTTPPARNCPQVGGPSVACDHQISPVGGTAVEECPAEPGPQPLRRASDSGSDDTMACPVAADLRGPERAFAMGADLRVRASTGTSPYATKLKPWLNTPPGTASTRDRRPGTSAGRSPTS